VSLGNNGIFLALLALNSLGCPRIFAISGVIQQNQVSTQRCLSVLAIIQYTARPWAQSGGFAIEANGKPLNITLSAPSLTHWTFAVPHTPLVTTVLAHYMIIEQAKNLCAIPTFGANEQHPETAIREVATLQCNIKCCAAYNNARP
jgi:hypothetical protein